jgi:hypothetical protein
MISNCVLERRFRRLPPLGFRGELSIRRRGDTGGERPGGLQRLVVAGLRFGDGAAQRLDVLAAGR